MGGFGLSFGFHFVLFLVLAAIVISAPRPARAPALQTRREEVQPPRNPMSQRVHETPKIRLKEVVEKPIIVSGEGTLGR